MIGNRIVRILLIAAALYVGGAVNMGIITLSPQLIPPPEGADLTTEEGLLKAAPLMQPKHFLLPWLAHALGTFVAAVLAAFLAPSIRHYSYWIPGGLFFHWRLDDGIHDSCTPVVHRRRFGPSLFPDGLPRP